MKNIKLQLELMIPHSRTWTDFAFYIECFRLNNFLEIYGMGMRINQRNRGI
jgi:hypothetical protein